MYMKVRKKYESISSKRKRNQLKPNKCKFLKKNCMFFFHRISENSITVKSWLRPNIIQICIIPQVDGYVNMIDDSLSHKHIGYYKPVNE